MTATPLADAARRWRMLAKRTPDVAQRWAQLVATYGPGRVWSLSCGRMADGLMLDPCEWEARRWIMTNTLPRLIAYHRHDAAWRLPT